MGREYEDDDGRTIADMSDLPDVSIVGRWSGIHKDDVENGRGFWGRGGRGSGGFDSGGNRNQIPAPEMDSDERRMYVLGMLKASLGIGMIYVLAFAVFIVVLFLIW